MRPSLKSIAAAGALIALIVTAFSTGHAQAQTRSAAGQVITVSTGPGDSAAPRIKRIPWQIGVFQ